MPRIKKISDEKVLDSALQVLHRKGPHGFTLQALTTVVGLAPATLLQRFGSKDNLLELALDRATVQLEEKVDAIGGSAISRVGLLRWVTQFFPQLGEDDRTLLGGHLELLARDIADERWRRRAARQLHLFRQGLSLHLKGLGSSRPDEHSEELEVLLHGLVIHWGLHGTGNLAAWLGSETERWLNRYGIKG